MFRDNFKLYIIKNKDESKRCAQTLTFKIEFYITSKLIAPTDDYTKVRNTNFLKKYTFSFGPRKRFYCTLVNLCTFIFIIVSISMVVKWRYCESLLLNYNQFISIHKVGRLSILDHGDQKKNLDWLERSNGKKSRNFASSGELR